MIQDVVDNALRHGAIDKIEVGRHHTHKVLRLFLGIMEGFGFTSFPRFYFKQRFKKVVPELNEAYLRKAFNPDEKELKVLKNGIENPAKIIFLKIHNQKKFQELHDIYTILNDENGPLLFDSATWLNLKHAPREIPHLESLISRYKDIQKLYQTYPNPLFFKLVKESIGNRPFHEIPLKKLETYISWAKCGWVQENSDLSGRLYFLNNSSEILKNEPWLHHFITKETLKEMRNETPHTQQGIEETEKCLKVVDLYHESGLRSESFFHLLEFLYQSKPEHFELTLRQNLSYVKKGYLKIEGPSPQIREQMLLIAVVGESRLESFFKLYYQHPLYLDDSRTLAQKIEILLPRLQTKSVEEVFKDEALIKIASNYYLLKIQKEITAKGGQSLFDAWIDKFDQNVKLGLSPITEDKAYPELQARIFTLTNLREQLLVKDEPRFHDAVAQALKGEESQFWVKVENNFLGSEYQVSAELYRSSPHATPLEGSVEERIKKVLPFARSVKEASFLLSLYVLKRAYRISLSYSYTLTDDLIQGLNKWIKHFPIEALPVKSLTELDNLLSFSLKQVFDGMATFEEINQIIESTHPKLSELTPEYFNRLAHAVQLFREHKMWLDKEDAYYDAIVPRISTRAFRAFLKAFIPSAEAELKPHLKIIEDKFSFNDPCPLTLLALKLKNPGHILLYFLDLLKNRGLHDLLQKDQFQTESLMRETLHRLKLDLRDTSWREIKKEYKDHLSAHFPECFVLPYLENFMDKVERVRQQKNANRLPKVPPVSEFILANLPTLIMALEALEAVKKLGMIGKYLLPRVLPFVLKLSTPYFTPNEKDAVVKIIGILLPDWSMKHDFYPLIQYMKELNSYITLNLTKPEEDLSQIVLSPEDKQKIGLITLDLMGYLITQVTSYKNILNSLLDELEKEIVQFSPIDLPS